VRERPPASRQGGRGVDQPRRRRGACGRRCPPLARWASHRLRDPRRHCRPPWWREAAEANDDQEALASRRIDGVRG